VRWDLHRHDQLRHQGRDGLSEAVSLMEPIQDQRKDERLDLIIEAYLTKDFSKRIRLLALANLCKPVPIIGSPS
jgi:hypothetical protein